MAQIIGGIGSSHVPTIGVAYDKGKQEHEAWAPLFNGYKAAAQWLAEKQPDLLIFFYNDHMNAFFYDLYPTFALGAAPSFEVADEGAGKRPLPPVPGNPAFAAHLTEQLVSDEFDITMFQDKPLDHGVFSPLPLLWPHHTGSWPAALIPVEINVLHYPLPTAMRCYKLGKAIRRAVESYPEDLRVVVVGTGGLSHQVHGERTGFNDTDWDMEFIDKIEHDPLSLARLRHVDYVRRGGAESVEQIMWLAMRGALSDDIRKVHQNYYLATTTAMTVMVFEENAPHASTNTTAISNPQTEGIEAIEGTYPFDLRVSTQKIALNRFFWNMKSPDCRRKFSEDERGACLDAGLTDVETELVLSRDWIGLIRNGANFFVLEKFARVAGETNLEVYAKMRGESYDAFMATRQVPGAT